MIIIVHTYLNATEVTSNMIRITLGYMYKW